MSVSIRRLEAGDAQAFRALWLLGLTDHPGAFTWDADAFAAMPLKRTQDWLAGAHAWGAFRGKELGGFAVVNSQTEKKRAHIVVIGPVYTVPELRGRGAGRALLQHALEHLPQGVEMVMLAAASDNTAAQKLYRSLGFRPWGVQPRALKLADGSYVDEEWMAWFKK